MFFRLLTLFFLDAPLCRHDFALCERGCPLVFLLALERDLRLLDDEEPDEVLVSLTPVPNSGAQGKIW